VSALRRGAPATEILTPEARLRRLDALAQALADEGRATEELIAALRRQRAGVAASDYRQVDESVRAMSRILMTLDEARKHRTALATRITDGKPVPLAKLEEHLGAPLPEPLAAVREAVCRSAELAANEIAINQRVLRRALESGDAFLQRLFSTLAPTGGVYGSPARQTEPEGGSVLLNRTA
jgi:hypothetical protein